MSDRMEGRCPKLAIYDSSKLSETETPSHLSRRSSLSANRHGGNGFKKVKRPRQ